MAIADAYLALHQAAQTDGFEIRILATKPAYSRTLDGSGGQEWLKPDLLVG